MPVCNKCAIEYLEGTREAATHQHLNSVESLDENQKDRELYLDNAFSAAVIGGTAQFISFLLVLTTQPSVSLVENLLLSSFIALCVGFIAYALLTGYDQISLRSRESSSETGYEMPDPWA